MQTNITREVSTGTRATSHKKREKWRTPICFTSDASKDQRLRFNRAHPSGHPFAQFREFIRKALFSIFKRRYSSARRT